MRGVVRRLRLGTVVKGLVRKLGLAPLEDKLVARWRQRAIIRQRRETAIALRQFPGGPRVLEYGHQREKFSRRFRA